jgi:LPS sulfotransferase NodH/predicted O-methyltransferase YrrM
MIPKPNRNVGSGMNVKIEAEQRPIVSMTDERLDFKKATPLRKSYLIASSYRCGSSYLCWLLWNTGLLGAPSEVWNATSELPQFINRFKTSEPSEYMTKILERRVSKNGVFGVKAHFHHFEAYQKQYPPLLKTIAPVTYIHINRPDKVAQGVSMVKALQTNRWHSRMEGGPKPTLHYDREMIANCIADIEEQDLAWRRWFKAHKVSPFELTYNELTNDAAGVVRRIVELLGVENDEAEEVSVPSVKKQGDETNNEWIERYEKETAADGRGAAVDDGGASPPARGAKATKSTKSTKSAKAAKPDKAPEAAEKDLSPEAPEASKAPPANFFDRHNKFARSAPAGAASATGFFDLIRLRRRYEVILAGNRGLFQNARVLDVMSGQGFWTLAALDAGAAHVVGVEPASALVETANDYFAKNDIRSNSYKFVNAELFVGLKNLGPGSIDLIFCHDLLEQYEIARFFMHAHRLRAKQVILDTGMAGGEGPLVRFSLSVDGLVGFPNHQLIMFLSDTFGFKWRLDDWRRKGISDWTGIHEYERDHRRTYILDRNEA